VTMHGLLLHRMHSCLPEAVGFRTHACILFPVVTVLELRMTFGTGICVLCY
jgi:hypothetical protein